MSGVIPLPPEYDLAAQVSRLIAARTVENATALSALAIVLGQTIATEAMPGGHEQVLASVIKAIREQMQDRLHVESLRKAGFGNLVSSTRIEL